MNDMETLTEGSTQERNHFGDKLSDGDDTKRRTWSDEFRFLGSNRLDSLKTVPPHLQFHGTTDMSVSEFIKEVKCIYQLVVLCQMKFLTTLNCYVLLVV